MTAILIRITMIRMALRMIITEAPEITAGITETVRTRIAAEKMAVLQETLPIIMAVLLQTAAQEAR